MKPAPDGFTWIANQSKGGSGLGNPGGLTVFKYNFVAPKLSVKKEHKRVGSKTEHYAVVQRSTTQDAVHDSYYPGPGEHLRLGMTAKINGKEYKHYVKFSQEMSAQIRKGSYFNLHCEADVYFVYSWPSRIHQVEDHFSSVASDSARLLICHGEADIRCKTPCCPGTLRSSMAS